MMTPEYTKAAEALAGKAILAKLNTQDYQQPAAQWGISGIPTMILFKNGKEQARKSGAMQASQIQSWILSQQ
jgi:thioredoxin 2